MNSDKNQITQSKKTDFELERFKLDKERFEFEKKVTKQKSQFFYRNIGILITAIISIASIIVSISQVNIKKVEVRIAEIQRDREITLKEKEIQIVKIQREKEINLLEILENKKWNMEALKFVADKKEIIFGKDSNESKQITDIMNVVFPIEILDPIYLHLKEASKDQKDRFEEAEKDVDKIIVASVEQSTKETLSPILIDDSKIDQEIYKLVDSLSSSDRGKASLELADLSKIYYDKVINTLFESILSPNNKLSYRKNLYIVLTLSRIKPDWQKDDKKYDKIKKLTESPNYKDSTFKKLVDKALEQNN